MSILVIGGTGTLGRQIVKRALDEGYTIKCLVRDFRRSIFLRDWGSYLVYGDLSKPSSIPLAFKSVHIVVDSANSRLFSNYNDAKVDGFGKLAILEISKLVQIKKYILFTIIAGPMENDWFNRNEKFPSPLRLREQLKCEILKSIIIQVKSEIVQAWIQAIIQAMRFELQQDDISFQAYIKSLMTSISKNKIVYIIFQCFCFFQGIIKEYAIPILEDRTIWVPSPNSCFNAALPYLDSRDAATVVVSSFGGCEGLTNSGVVTLHHPSYRIKLTNAFTTYDIIKLCERLAGKKAKILVIPDSILKKLESFFAFFKITKRISEIMSTSRLLMQAADFSHRAMVYCMIKNLQIFPDVETDRLFLLDNPLELKIYLTDYFIQMLKKLREINYQDQKSDKISFL